MKPFFYMVTILSFFSSCTAYHHGSLMEGEHQRSEKTLIKHARGYAKVNRFLFFGGTHTDALVADAKMNLLMNNTLEEGQYFANSTLDFKESFNLLGIHSTKAIITAEIRGSGGSGYLDSLRAERLQTYSNLEIGQTVYLPLFGDRVREVKVLALENNRVTIGYFDKQHRYRIRNVSASNLKKTKLEKDSSASKIKLNEKYDDLPKPGNIGYYYIQGKYREAKVVGSEKNVVTIEFSDRKNQLRTKKIHKSFFLKEKPEENK